MRASLLYATRCKVGGAILLTSWKVPHFGRSAVARNVSSPTLLLSECAHILAWCSLIGVSLKGPHWQLIRVVDCECGYFPEANISRTVHFRNIVTTGLYDANKKLYWRYRMVAVSMILSDLWPGFQGRSIFRKQYKKQWIIESLNINKKSYDLSNVNWIFHRMCRWNFSIFGKDIDKNLRLTFWHTL